MKYSTERTAPYTARLRRLAWLIVLVLSAGGITLLPPVSQPAEAMCCACTGCTTGGGFCADSIANPLACANLCAGVNCSNTVYDNTDTCDGGCGVATLLPTGTPTQTPTQTGTPTITGTPSQTPTRTPTNSPTASPTRTPTITPTVTVTATPTITPTVTATPTPETCCQLTTPAPVCKRSLNFNVCDPGLEAHIGNVCDSVAGQCVTATATNTRTVTRTPTITPTETPTRTFTNTPTDTPTVTPTPQIPTSIDPYKCYRIKDDSAAKFQKPEVRLVDQFGVTTTAVLKPFLVCNPAIETTTAQTPGFNGDQVNPDAHLVCFRVRDRTDPQMVPSGIETHVDFHDLPSPTPFTVEKFKILKANLLCMPAAKLLPTPTNTPKPTNTSKTPPPATATP